MPRPSRSTLIMPRSAQSSLSHCTTVRPGMEARSRGTTRVQLALADDHAAGVLAEMAWQVLHAHAELKILGDARMLQVEAGVMEAMRHGVVLPRHSHWLTRLDSAQASPASKPSALPTSRAADLPR